MKMFPFNGNNAAIVLPHSALHTCQESQLRENRYTFLGANKSYHERLMTSHHKSVVMLHSRIFVQHAHTPKLCLVL
uniref:Uncharacterized protein n=1 Tax=Steinernema glaseri TaxID=37863 RepID=A0A1I7ZA32_9BILA